MAWKFNPFTDELDYFEEAVSGAGVGAIVTETSYGQTEAVGVGITFARADHTHGTPPEPFPVGAYYFNSTGVDPGTELGYGTWTQVAQGNFLVGHA